MKKYVKLINEINYPNISNQNYKTDYIILEPNNVEDTDFFLQQYDFVKMVKKIGAKIVFSSDTTNTKSYSENKKMWDYVSCLEKENIKGCLVFKCDKKNSYIENISNILENMENYCEDCFSDLQYEYIDNIKWYNVKSEKHNNTKIILKIKLI